MGQNVDREHSVLVVDDDKAMLLMTEMILEGEGYPVKKCLSPEIALEIEEAPSLVVTDLEMPGMNGNILIQRLREKFPDIYIPCLLVTATDSEDLDLQAFSKSEGRENVITKPFELDNLLDCVKRKIT